MIKNIVLDNYCFLNGKNMKKSLISFLFLICIFLIGCSKSDVSANGFNVDNTKTEIKNNIQHN